ncbi:MAG: hypothetical protein M3067_05475 [Chloroflexota bacterium]|nr:hypothetical protein [Chloroflexota bacterium]
MPRSDPFTVRFHPRIEARIAQIAKETKRSKSAVVEELVDEAERTRRFPGIAFNGPDWSRRAWVMGTALDVWQIIEAWQDYDEDGERMLSNSHLTERQLKIALAYYREFAQEIDEAVAGNRRSLDELRSDFPFIEVFESPD